MLYEEKEFAKYTGNQMCISEALYNKWIPQPITIDVRYEADTKELVLSRGDRYLLVKRNSMGIFSCRTYGRVLDIPSERIRARLINDEIHIFLEDTLDVKNELFVTFSGTEVRFNNAVTKYFEDCDAIHYVVNEGFLIIAHGEEKQLKPSPDGKRKHFSDSKLIKKYELSGRKAAEYTQGTLIVDLRGE